MAMSSEERERLETRLRVMLPKLYQEGEVLPVSMGSAGLKYGSDGRVAWDAIWGSFCDLAMAGGPPHRGTLLEPGSEEEIRADPDRYGEVVAEICRGIGMVTGLWAERSELDGWVRVYCTSAAMAGWLARAIAMENVSVRFKGLVLSLPAGAGYRLEKEIKNVVTAMAKTCHYWKEHMSPEQHDAIGMLFREMEAETPLVQHGGWVGVECGDVGGAIRTMRALVVSNVLARREGTAVFVPVGCDGDVMGRACEFAAVRG